MLTYQMDSRKGKTKTVFLYDCIKEDIISGELRAGERLPSKRSLAEHLAISVVTVENAYIMLEEEGYITAKAGSGFYVNELSLMSAGHQEMREMQLLPEEKPKPGSEYSFFPSFARITRKILSEKPEILAMKPPHLGCSVLRNAIAGYLRRYRGMDVLPSHIIIGSGAEYLYSLIVQLFGREIEYGIEKPSYEKIAQVYKANGAKVTGLEMGSDGIKSDALKSSEASVLHVTPFHSFPSGITATAEKRYEYLSWASEREAYIVEDDFDSEFAAPKKPIETLYSMDRNERVIYLNTFSKSIASSIRIGYMILPDKLLEKYMN